MITYFYSIILLSIGLASEGIGMLFLIRAVSLNNLRISLLEQRLDERGQ